MSISRPKPQNSTDVLLGCVYILPALNQNRSKIDKTEIPNR